VWFYWWDNIDTRVRPTEIAKIPYCMLPIQSDQHLRCVCLAKIRAHLLEHLVLLYHSRFSLHGPLPIPEASKPSQSWNLSG
jgi:hypothetical protein